MPEGTLIEHATHTMAVCNACRYCEQYCAVFPAIEQRLAFGKGDLTYLANLCHNCGECLYACQYAPPHEFGINVPRTLAQLRRRSYEELAWPQLFAKAYHRHAVALSLLLVAAFTVIMFAAAPLVNPFDVRGERTDANFYAVVPHGTLVTLFGSVALFVTLALTISIVRLWREMHRGASLPVRHGIHRGIADVLYLRNLHAGGVDCTIAEETRTPWRRWYHHATFYGFLLCFASTSVAAVYHTFFGWLAPYGYFSVPVVLGTSGGIGLTIGPIGLWWLRLRRDRDLSDPDQDGLDAGFILLLVLTSITGLILLASRQTTAMPGLLIVHLAIVLALFVTLPYGKFVHGLFRTAALLKFAREEDGAEK
jgi:citrate/tricarballylate utilization protein